MDYQMGGSIVFLFLLAIALFSYFQSSRRAEVLDRRRRNTVVTDGSREGYELR